MSDVLSHPAESLLFTLFFGILSPPLVAEPAAGNGQLGAPVERIAVGEVFYEVQTSRDGRLFLTPDESFFPRLGLTATGEGAIPDVDGLNGGKSFDRIIGWHAGDQAEWPIRLLRAGKLSLQAHTSPGAENHFSIQLDDEEKALGTEPLTFTAKNPGLHRVRVTCLKDALPDLALRWIEASGPAVEGAGVIRQRWRPAAAHAKFSGSAGPDSVRIWIMEMDAAPGTLDFYAPITTPFGYYGPSWRADGTVGSSLNFSLWSYGRNQPEPPVEQLSHLLAIGDRDAQFGGFGHEGTGVKIRGWEPLMGRQGQRQALALRLEPGEKYSTYYAYFFANDENRWRLFGVGRKPNPKGRPLNSMAIGSFVEVPGPPTRQRTGAYERPMRYRGWTMDADGTLHPLNRMSTGNVDRQTGLTNSDRGTTADGWFFLQTGGLGFRKPAAGGFVEAPVTDTAAIPFLAPDALKALTAVPSSVRVRSIERTENEARIAFDIRNAGHDAEVLACYGETEALTFAERWQHRKEIGTVADGENRITLTGISAHRPLRLRLLLRNDDGQFWSMETAVSEPR